MDRWRHLLLITVICGGLILDHSALQAQSSHGVAVLELYTSEGCSSCPAAEDAVAEIAKEDNKNVYILEFHVDYWDRLGWKDFFSSAAYSERQQTYGGKLSLQNIYTPQAIVNGSEELIGSDKSGLQKIIRKELTENQSAEITIKTQIANNQSVSVSYRIHDTDRYMLNIALVQLKGSTKVLSGENKGRLLHHMQIVRNFKTIDHPDQSGKISIEIPTDITTENARIIAYLQDKRDWKIYGATQSGLSN